MQTPRQKLGDFGETSVIHETKCLIPNCRGTLKQLPVNTPSYDLECIRCGERYQVKTLKCKQVDLLPRKLLGAAWGPQSRLLDEKEPPSIFLVLIDSKNTIGIWFIDKKSQALESFVVRKPLSEKAKSPGWIGFYIEIGKLIFPPVRLV